MILAAITIETPETVNTVLGFFSKGGLFMWPLLACSIVSVTIMILRGLAEALNATVFGLSSAVPTLIGFTYFSRKVEVMSVEMETLVVELINKSYYGRSSREFAPAKASAGTMPISTPVA